MKLALHRTEFHLARTIGTLSVDGRHFGYTCEDIDRHMENGGEKVYGHTAIPRGAYRVVTSFSHRFQKVMPEVLDVPGFSGVRIHGGNTEADTLGCPLLGAIKTPTGVAKCKEVNNALVQLIEAAEDRGEQVWLEVA